MKNKLLVYFGIVIGATIIFTTVDNVRIVRIGISYIFPLIYAIFLILNLFEKSKHSQNFSYWKGLKKCFEFGTYATLIFTSLTAFYSVIRVTQINRQFEIPRDIDPEVIFSNVLYNGETALVNGVIYTVLLSIIIPFFFIKNKTPESNIILDDEKF